MNILNKLGLMTVAEHEAVKAGFLRDIKAEREKFKASSRDLADLAFQIEALRPDALLWRAARLKRRGNK